MRLSQIRIAGFKSFVDPSKIAFPANVTAIVGPNGCGKSNVIDAVRWVMGESSARNLRGESMEDVIFSGSSSRQPVGQASVELIFDNADGRIAGEYAKYAEISVKRIATRAGQSKYYLNNTRCRRRDIADIFLGTGLGPRSYSIIEQGMVSRVIDAKPDELRVYFEEAAGISKYKERRRETENRIRHTRENLDRLIDLIEEIDSQLARLDRQSKTAEKYKALKAELRQVEAERLLLQKRVFDHDSETQQRKLTSVETALQERIAALRGTEREIEQGRARLTEASERLNAVQGEYYRVGADIAAREQTIEHRKNLRQLNRQELESLGQAAAEARDLLAADERRLGELERQGHEVQPSLEAAGEELERHQTALDEAEAEMQQWQELWEQFRREYHQVHESAQIENRGIEHIERQVRHTEERRSRLAGELETLDASELVKDIDALESRVEANAEEYAATMAQAQSRAEEIQQLRAAIEELAAALDSERNRLQTLGGRLSSLEALQQHVLAEGSDAVRDWLERNRIDSSRRLAGMLRVRGNADKAVEAVLSPFLGAYCLAQGSSMPDALVPDHTLALLGPDLVRQAPAKRDWPQLIDYVECDIDLSSLLAGVYLCEDLQELRYKRGQLEAGESLVSLQGLWAGRNWVLQIGEEDQHRGMLAREQEIEQLRGEAKTLKQSTLDLKSRLDGERERLRAQERQWDDEQKALAELQQQLGELRQQLSQRHGQAEQVQARRQQLHAELAELDELKAGQTDELESNAARRNDYLDQIAKMTELEAALQQQKTERQQNLTAARDALHAARDRSHQLQMQAQALDSERRALAANIERLRQQTAQHAARQQELSLAIDDADDPIAQLEGELQTLLAARNENQQALDRAQQQVGEADHRLRELEAERNARQQRVDEIRNQLESERMQLQEARIRASTIEEQLAQTGLDTAALAQNLAADAEPEAWDQRREKLGNRIDRLGPINLAAIEEYEEQAERKQYLDAQHQDLVTALATLEDAIRKIDRETKERFKDTFEQVNTRLGERFPKLFGGGEAHLEMTENDLLNTGVQIMARPPGKRITNLQLLSGGEKALTAVALIFAIFELNPSPFCMLDEVDAPLDDANVGRFCSMVAEMAEQVQFIMITHNKITMEMAQTLNGVTMHEPGVSRLVSVDVDDAVVLAGVQ